MDSILIPTRDNASISAIVIYRKDKVRPQAALLQFTIYVRDSGRDLATLKESADHGYIGVIAYTRGKRTSVADIYPYEHDANDAYDVIDWISRQSWCNGNVGMFGGSYNGFTQWAAAKKLHPALKTIVPAVANRPGMGLPMENNVFINPNYEWAFYVGNNRYLDTATANDRPRFRRMQNRWWESGVAYNKMDSIDGTTNKWFQRWIAHPSFDDYWQKMAPYGEEFDQIKIPVLAFDGYYNDSQNSSLYFLRQHQKYNPGIPAYLVIGPYGHFGTQVGGERMVNGCEIDSTALFTIKKLTYEWFDHILKAAPKPSFLEDRINYFVMQANEWRHASSMEAMSNDTLQFYLSSQKKGKNYTASKKKPANSISLKQTVDFTNRIIANNDSYPSPIIRKQLTDNGLFFISEPLEEPLIVNGSFFGNLTLSINKLDFDFGVTLYEVLPTGEYFHLSYTIVRASYANDMTTRTLLKPGVKYSLPFSNTKLISKQIQKGSRFLIAVNINKNPFAQLNYGTGRDVSTETIADGKVPLIVKWFNDSWVSIPILK